MLLKNERKDEEDSEGKGNTLQLAMRCDGRGEAEGRYCTKLVIIELCCYKGEE